MIKQYIVTGYTDDQAGLDIRDEDVVRPLDHIYAEQGSAETYTWKIKSNGRCPTYGNCRNCTKSGPVDKICNDCQTFNGFHPRYEIKISECYRIMDAQTLAESLDMGHEIARADRKYVPNMGRVKFYTNADHRNRLERKYRHIVGGFEREIKVNEKMTEFHNLFGLW